MPRRTPPPKADPDAVRAVNEGRRIAKVPAKCPNRECGCPYAIEGRRIIHTYADGTQDEVGTMCVCAMCGTSYLSVPEGVMEPRMWFGIVDPPKGRERQEMPQRERDDELPSSIDDHRWRR